MAFRGLVLAAVVANALVVAGPILKLRPAAVVYYHFYRHGSPDNMVMHLEHFGRRPLGFCRKDVGAVDPSIVYR